MHVQSRVPPNIHVFIDHLPSEHSKGIQMADLLSWGIFRKYNTGDVEWYDIYKHRIASEAIFEG